MLNSFAIFFSLLVKPATGHMIIHSERNRAFIDREQPPESEPLTKHTGRQRPPQTRVSGPHLECTGSQNATIM